VIVLDYNRVSVAEEDPRVSRSSSPAVGLKEDERLAKWHCENLGGLLQHIPDVFLVLGDILHYLGTTRRAQRVYSTSMNATYVCPWSASGYF